MTPAPELTRWWAGLNERLLGREATARTAKTLVFKTPFFAPAACWCARTMVESIIWTLSWPAPVSLSAWSITSHPPDSVQRRNWR